MSYQFFQGELNAIYAAATAAQAGAKPWYEVYDLVVSFLEHPQGTVTDQPAVDLAIKWFTGAADVNRDSGPFATLIRSYSEREMELHFGYKRVSV